MTADDVRQFMREFPGEMLPLGSGAIDAQFALNLLEGDEPEPMDILKRQGDK